MFIIIIIIYLLKKTEYKAMYNNNRPNGTELIKMAKQFFDP